MFMSIIKYKHIQIQNEYTVSNKKFSLNIDDYRIVSFVLKGQKNEKGGCINGYISFINTVYYISFINTVYSITTKYAHAIYKTTGIYCLGCQLYPDSM